MSSHLDVDPKAPETVGDGHEDVRSDVGCMCACQKCRKPRYWLWILGFALFYVLSVIPVGLGVYALKSQAGIELLKHGGYHAALRCLHQATQRNF
jgi:hypothetical protein